MGKNIDAHIFQGMQRDNSISKQPAQFLWDAHNIRITARDNDSQFAITNERGPKEVTDINGDVIEFVGTYLGHCVLGKYLVVFTRDENEVTDYIYRVQKDGDKFTKRVLFEGDLNFSLSSPIETLGDAENSLVQKVYWVDGRNQPRFLNITRDLLEGNFNYTPTSFNFVQDLQLKEDVKIYKVSSSTGVFPAGVIQYAITYFNKYGQESNIVYTSPLLYTCHSDRAGNPEESLSNAFKIAINNPDTNFDFVRIYSIFRTSLDDQVTVKQVADLKIPKATPPSIIDGKTVKGYAPTVTRYTFDSLEDLKIYYNKEEVGNFYNFINNQEDFFEDAPDGFPRNTPWAVRIKEDDGYYTLITKDVWPNIFFSCNKGNIRSEITWGDNTIFLIKNNPNSSNEYIIRSTTSEYRSNRVGMTYVQGTGEGFFKLSSYTIDEPEEQDTSSESDLEFIDNNTYGGIIDPTYLLYVGGEEIIPYTLQSKDGTLFLGNYSINRPFIENNIKEELLGQDLVQDKRTIKVRGFKTDYYKYYPNTLVVNPAGQAYLDNATTFKNRETYRFGVQFQYKNGKWSSPIFIKDETISNAPDVNSETDELNLPVVRFTYDFSEAYKLGYRKVRGVVVIPSINERHIIAQGILAPTVYNYKQREEKGIYAQSSWFFRPTANIFTTSSNYSEDANAVYRSNGAIDDVKEPPLQYIHDRTLFSGVVRASEIGNVPVNFSNVYKGDLDDKKVDLKSYLGSDAEGYSLEEYQSNGLFLVDQQIVTMHSPDVEVSDYMYFLDTTNLQLQLVGKAYWESAIGDIDIQTSSVPIKGLGFIRNNYSYLGNPSYGICAGLFYSDYFASFSAGIVVPWGATSYLWMVYPWHPQGSINNDWVRGSEGGTRTSVLSKKIISNLKYFSTVYQDVADTSFFHPKVQSINFFSTDQPEAIKFIHGNDYKLYSANIDIALTPVGNIGNTFAVGNSENGQSNSKKNIYSDKNVKFSASRSYIFYSTYTGYIHSNTTENINVPPTLFQGGKAESDGYKTRANSFSNKLVRMKYKSSPHLVISLLNTLNHDIETEKTYLRVAELYRAEHPTFGGTSEGALKSNIWLPAGDAVVINSKGDTTVEYKWGDTWFQRFDCLKTYPFTKEDENSIVEIGSFMLETRVNVDGRWDRNRAQIDNLSMSPTNFNQINKVYSQLNNFFTYRIYDDDYYKTNKYINNITWTKEKQPASDIDNWTNITLASQLQLNGDKGKVNKLELSDDNLYCFQDKAVSIINFNARAQISTSDGLPIEISNNYKVDGKKIVSDTVGCSNKWTITKGDNILYFLDTIGKAIYDLKGMQITNLSDTKGFATWYNNQENIWEPWSPLNYTAKSFYDFGYKDFYFSTGETSLVFSDFINNYVSFMDYGNVDTMFNMDQDFFSIKDGKLWQMFKGEYNNFFGKYKPFDFTFVSNQNSTVDKIFTNLEYRADFYNQGEVEHFKTFDYIQAYNEYQDTGETVLNARKKFRVWRTDIPRNKRTRDRIRNTWTKIKLGTYNNNDIQDSSNMELHDMLTIYYD